MIQVALGDVAGEAAEVGDATPGLQADEGAAGFVWGPDAVSFGLVTADGEVWPLLLVQ